MDFDEELNYSPLQRPKENNSEMMELVSEPIVYSSEEEEGAYSSSDSEDSNGIPTKFAPKRKIVETHATNGASIAKQKKYHVWSEILEQEVIESHLVETNFFDKSGRGAESYNYQAKLPNDNDKNESCHSRNWRSRRKEDECRRMKHVSKYYGNQKQRILPKLNIYNNQSDQEFAKVMAINLHEPKVDLIERIIQNLGKEKAVEIYDRTREIERVGGIQTSNCNRRRKSGGVYLKLLKDENLPKNVHDAIFPDGNRRTKRKSKRSNCSLPEDSEWKEFPDLYQMLIPPGNCDDDDSNNPKNPPPSPVHDTPSTSSVLFSLADCLSPKLNPFSNADSQIDVDVPNSESDFNMSPIHCDLIS